MEDLVGGFSEGCSWLWLFFVGSACLGLSLGERPAGKAECSQTLLELNAHCGCAPTKEVPSGKVHTTRAQAFHAL